MSCSGIQLDLCTASPSTVKGIFEHDVGAWLWREAAARHAHLAHLDGPPYLVEIRALLRDSGVFTRKLQGLLMAYLAGAFFRTTVCRCGEVFAEPTHWWAHFVWQCPNTAEARELLKLPLPGAEEAHSGLPQTLQENMIQFMRTPWIATGLLPDPRVRFPPPAEPEACIWSNLFGECPL